MENTPQLTQIRALVKQGFYDSALLLLQFQQVPSRGKIRPQAELLYLEGTIHLKRQEYNRALNCFRNSIIQLSKEARLGQTSTAISMSDVRMRAAQCHRELKCPEKAFKELSSIPESSRSMSVLLMMAQLCEQVGAKGRSMSLFKEILQRNPYAVEAAVAMVRLSSSPGDVMQIINCGVQQENREKKGNRRTKPGAASASKAFALRWLEPLLEGHSSMYSFQNREALDKFSRLDRTYHENLHLQLMMANCHIQMQSPLICKHVLEKAALIDPYNVEGMDVLAVVVKNEGDQMGLNRLARKLLKLSPNRAEPWLAIAAYCEMKGQKQRALKLIEKAIEIDPNHRHAYFMKGHIHLSFSNNSEEAARSAVSSFRRALLLQKSLPAYVGLVKAHLRLPTGRHEALAMARDAQQLFAAPHPVALTLLALVLMTCDEKSRAKARKLLNNALKLSPDCWEAVNAMVTLEVSEENFDAAINLLKRALNNNVSRDDTHTRLGEVYAKADKPSEAMMHFHMARSINPLNHRALKGLEKLEKAVAGLDNSDDDEHTHDISDDDQEEAGGLSDESFEPMW